MWLAMLKKFTFKSNVLNIRDSLMVGRRVSLLSVKLNPVDFKIIIMDTCTANKKGKQRNFQIKVAIISFQTDYQYMFVKSH